MRTLASAILYTSIFHVRQRHDERFVMLRLTRSFRFHRAFEAAPRRHGHAGRRGVALA